MSVTRRNVPFTKARNADQWHLKEKVKAPTILQCLFRQKYCKRSIYYFTSGRKVNEAKVRDVGKEPTPFWYPPDTDQFCFRVVERSWREQTREREKELRYTERPTYRSRQRQDLLERLHLPEEEVDTLALPGILDIDPEFFKVIQGRPERGTRFNIKKYVEDVRETVKIKLKTGYHEDEIFQVDEQFIEEQKRIDQIKETHKIYVDSFEEFLAEDHEDSMNLLSLAGEYAKGSMNMGNEYKRLLRTQETLRCRVYILEEHWRDCKLFQRFLYQTSPMSWRKDHDYINKVDGSVDSIVSGDVGSLFGRYRLAMTEGVPSLESLIEMFTDDVEHEKPPVLYFEEPSQLMTVFENLERRNLDSMMQMMGLVEPLERMNMQLNTTRKLLDVELNFAKNKVREMSRTILAAEKRAMDLEESSKSIMDGLLRKSVIGDEVLNLYIFVEDAFQTTVAVNDNNLEMVCMMRGLEHKYVSLLRELDSFPRHIVREVEREVYSVEAHRMICAHDATSKLHQMERLMYKLHRSLAPPPPRRKKQLMFRSQPPGTGPKRDMKEQEITQEDVDYLLYFTEFCENQDDMKHYLQEYPGGSRTYMHFKPLIPHPPVALPKRKHVSYPEQ